MNKNIEDDNVTNLSPSCLHGFCIQICLSDELATTPVCFQILSHVFNFHIQYPLWSTLTHFNPRKNLHPFPGSGGRCSRGRRWGCSTAQAATPWGERNLPICMIVLVVDTTGGKAGGTCMFFWWIGGTTEHRCSFYPKYSETEDKCNDSWCESVNVFDYQMVFTLFKIKMTKCPLIHWKHRQHFWG